MSYFDDFVASMVGSGATGESVAAMPDQQRLPLAEAAVGGALQSFGSYMGGVSHIQYGLQAQQAAHFEATQLRINATQAQASAQRQAYDVGMQTQFITSRALAVAAASGGGASDPTVVSLIARDAARGAYLKSVALYQGDDRARLLDMQADAKEFQGRETRDNSMMVGASQFAYGGANSILNGAKVQSLYRRFGGGSPLAAGSGDAAPTDAAGEMVFD